MESYYPNPRKSNLSFSNVHGLEVLPPQEQMVKQASNVSMNDEGAEPFSMKTVEVKHFPIDQ